MRSTEQVVDAVIAVARPDTRMGEQAIEQLVRNRDVEWVGEVTRMFRDWWWQVHECPVPADERRFLDRLTCLQLGHTHYDGRRE